MVSRIEKINMSNTRGIALVLHYFLGYLFLYRVIATQITLFIDAEATTLLPTIQWGIYLFTAGIAILLAWPHIKISWLNFIQNRKFHLMFILKSSVLILILNITASILISLITQTNNSANQIGIETASKIEPIITMAGACLFAPLIEECVFRVGIFFQLRRNINFIIAAIISSLLFGAIHVMDSIMVGNYLDMSYLIVYSIMGLVLAFSLERSNTVFVPIGIHIINNVISFIIMLA